MTRRVQKLSHSGGTSENVLDKWDIKLSCHVLWDIKFSCHVLWDIKLSCHAIWDIKLSYHILWDIQFSCHVLWDIMLSSHAIWVIKLSCHVLCESQWIILVVHLTAHLSTRWSLVWFHIGNITGVKKKNWPLLPGWHSLHWVLRNRSWEGEAMIFITSSTTRQLVNKDIPNGQ